MLYLPTLDGWRALAVAAVVAYHLQWARGVFVERPLQPILEQGKFGVDLFFAISGYLITHRMLAEHAKTGRVSLGGFYVRRVFRIIPPALLYLGFIAVAPLPSWHPPSLEEWLGCLLFFRNYVTDGLLITGHFWSLSVEEHFYLLWPTLFLIRSVRSRLWILPVAAVAIAVWRALVFADRIPPVFMSDSITEFRTDVRLDAILWGAWLALVMNDATWRERIRRRLSFVPWLLCVGAFWGSTYLSTEPEMSVKAFVAPFIILGTVYHPEWLVSRLLEFRPLRFIGGISYGIYLFQQAFLPLNPWRAALIVPCAIASFYLVERPMMEMGRQLVARKRSNGTRNWRHVAAAGLLAAALVAFVAVARRASAQEIPALRGTVAVRYDGMSMQGAQVTLGEGRYFMGSTGAVGNDAISSLVVGSTANVKVCVDFEDGDGAGRCHTYHRGARVRYVGGDLNDRISFVEVTRR